MRNVIELIQLAGAPPLHQHSPAIARELYAKGADILEVPKAGLARVQALSLPARDGALLPARLYAALDSPAALPALPVLLYFHGGGYTIGSIDTHDTLCRELARLSGAAVVSLEYRLAPEHQFPVAVNDAWDALQWLHAHGGALGLDTSRMAVGGDSAGGNLAAHCALMAREAGMPLALQMLFYPCCAEHNDTASHQTYASGYVLDAANIAYFFNNYLPDKTQRNDWRFAPLNAADHSGLAPAWIGLAECDPLVDEGVLYADTLRRAGVAVDIEIYQGVAHEFIKMGRALPEAKLAHQHAAAALRKAFGQANKAE